MPELLAPLSGDHYSARWWKPAPSKARGGGEGISGVGARGTATPRAQVRAALPGPSESSVLRDLHLAGEP